MNFLELVVKFLPPTAQILNLNNPSKRVAILFTDLDGDGLCEITAAYKYNEENYIIILKNSSGHWFPLAHLKGTGYNINYLGAYPITSSKTNNLIVGWQIGSIWSELNIFEFTQNGFTNIVPNATYYSKINIEAMPNKSGKYSGYNIALWLQDTGEAYNVEVYGYINGKFKPDPEVYPYYFKKVAVYYKRKVIEFPDAAFYWYHLAITWLQANMTIESLYAVNKALNFISSYSSYKEKFIRLKQVIISKLSI